MKKNILTSIGLTAFFAVGIMSLNLLVDSGSTSVHAFSGGSDGGRTNSPGDIAGVSAGQTANCTNCHSGTLNSGTATRSITSDIPAGGYVTGQTYTITATVAEASVNKYGFEVTAEKDADNSKVGTMVITNSTETKVIGGSAVTHKSTGTSGTGTKTWSFDWTAPAVGTGDVTFYGAFNATNGNSATSGDKVYTATLSVTESATNNVSEVSSKNIFTIYPNPVVSSFEISTDMNMDAVIVYGMDGRIITSIVQNENIFDASGLPSGIYFVKVVSEGKTLTKKLIKK